MPTYELDPISRIEGHLGAKLTESGGEITDVEVHGNLWRGFENFLIGREPNDAITFTQRICGVCPVPHGQSATFATEAAIGYTDISGNSANRRNFQTPDREKNVSWGVPAKAVHVRNIVLGAEFLMSSLTHFYHLAAPSYIQGPAVPPWTPYFADSYYHTLLLSWNKGIGAASPVTPPNYQTDNSGNATPGAVLPRDAVDISGNSMFSADLWSAIIKQYVKALRIRRLALEAGALFAGRMPMTSCYVAGGVTTYKDEDLTNKADKMLSLMTEIATFVIREYVPLVLALGLLYSKYDNIYNVGLDGSGNGYGAGCGNFLSWGGFPKVNTVMDAAGVSGNTFPRGFRHSFGGAALGFATADTSGNITSADVVAATSDTVGLREDITYSRYNAHVASGYKDASGNASDVSRPSLVTRTVPQRAKAGAYSWLKAPRYQGKPYEVGPLARLAVMQLWQNNAPLIDQSGNAVQQLAWAYAKDVSGNLNSLDPRMIDPDLAVACVRAGIATVWSGNSDITAVISTLTTAQLATAYYDRDTHIRGALRDWIVAMRLGLSTMDRIRARCLESAWLLTQMVGGVNKTTYPIGTAAPVTFGTTGWIYNLRNKVDYSGNASYYHISVPTGPTLSDSFGFGAAEAPRGALMHMCTLDNKGKIKAYQCIVPTTWNASPKDVSGNKGPMEQAIAPTNTTTGPQRARTPYSSAGGKLYPPSGGGVQTTQGGVEALRIAQSFDPCIACAVH